MFDDPALEMVAGYWQARHVLDGALRAVKAASLDLSGTPEETAWGEALRNLEASFLGSERRSRRRRAGRSRC
jgi:hypothetical protein